MNPHLLATAALYLACKVEECSISLRRLINDVRKHAAKGKCRSCALGPAFTALTRLARTAISQAIADEAASLALQRSYITPITNENLLEAELCLLEALNFDLIIFHPYRPLQLCVAHAFRSEVLARADHWCAAVS